MTPLLLAMTAVLTGARLRGVLVPPGQPATSTPFATTLLAVARKLVIFAVSEKLGDVPPLVGGVEFAVAGAASAAANASAEKAAATSLRIASSFG
jgi:hypothetical protein